MDRSQAAVAEWVALQTISDVCSSKTDYARGGKLRVPWWRQATAEKQLRVMLEEILSEAREQRRQESVRCVEVKVGTEESDSGGDR